MPSIKRHPPSHLGAEEVNHARVTYVADIGQDVDDLIAAEALMEMGVLRCVVLDPLPADDEGLQRVEQLVAWGIPVSDDIPEDVRDVFVGGALTKVARFLHKGGHIERIVMNGGFAGANVVAAEQRLRKFRNKTALRTYNFNLDVNATDEVLSSDAVGSIMLVGKNVCHSPLNTTTGIWRESMEFLDRFGLNPGKKLHDLLMVCEGLVEVGLSGELPSCEYRMLYPFNEGLNGDMTRWGSAVQPTGYVQAKVATGWMTEAPRHDFIVTASC